MRPPEGVHWTDAKVSPRPEIPAFCKNTDTPTSTVSPVANSDVQELGRWFQDNVPGSAPTLFRTSNTPRPTGGLRPPFLQVLSTQEAESPSFLLPVATLRAVPSSRGARLSHQPHGCLAAGTGIPFPLSQGHPGALVSHKIPLWNLCPHPQNPELEETVEHPVQSLADVPVEPPKDTPDKCLCLPPCKDFLLTCFLAVLGLALLRAFSSCDVWGFFAAGHGLLDVEASLVSEHRLSVLRPQYLRLGSSQSRD